MTDGPSLQLLQQPERSDEPLTIYHARTHFVRWLEEHPGITAQIGEEMGLTIYLAGLGYGIELAMQQMGLTPSTRIPASQDFGGIEEGA
jgi:hypothetical protein